MSKLEWTEPSTHAPFEGSVTLQLALDDRVGPTVNRTRLGHVVFRHRTNTWEAIQLKPHFHAHPTHYQTRADAMACLLAICQLEGGHT